MKRKSHLSHRKQEEVFHLMVHGTLVPFFFFDISAPPYNIQLKVFEYLSSKRFFSYTFETDESRTIMLCSTSEACNSEHLLSAFSYKVFIYHFISCRHPSIKLAAFLNSINSLSVHFSDSSSKLCAGARLHLFKHFSAITTSFSTAFSNRLLKSI